MKKKFEVLAYTSKGKQVVIATVEAETEELAKQTASRFVCMCGVSGSRLREIKK